MELHLIQIYLYSIKIDSRCFRNPQPGASNSGNDQPPYIGKKPEAGPDWGVWALSTFLYSHNSGAFLDVYENKTNVNSFSQACLSPEAETCQTVLARTSDMGPQTCLLSLSRQRRSPADPYGPTNGSPLALLDCDNTHTHTGCCSMMQPSMQNRFCTDPSGLGRVF